MSHFSAWSFAPETENKERQNLYLLRANILIELQGTISVLSDPQLVGHDPTGVAYQILTL